MSDQMSFPTKVGDENKGYNPLIAELRRRMHEVDPGTAQLLAKAATAIVGLESGLLSIIQAHRKEIAALESEHAEFKTNFERAFNAAVTELCMNVNAEFKKK